MNNQPSNHLESEFQAIHSKLNKSLPKGLIYHYTSFNGLKNIIKERKLRHTDYRYFNDPTELQYGKDIILNVILNAGIHQKKIDRLKELFDNFDKLSNWYIACFSTEIKKLALWRYYASNGTGFAIGFNEKFHKAEYPEEAIGKPIICKVNYGNDAIATVNSFIKKYLQYGGEQNFKLLITHLLSVLPALKDDSFQDEHEIRLFYIEGKMILDSTGQPFYFASKHRGSTLITKNQPRFVKKTLGKKPFITPHDFSKDEISEIWIGPACEYKAAAIFIKNLLVQEGYNIKNIEIKQPPLPYRNI